MILFDKVYSVFLNPEVAIESKYSLIELYKPEWNDIERYKKIHSYIEKALSEGVNPNILTCTMHMRENGFFTTAFKVIHISDIAHAFSWDNIQKFTIYLNDIERLYILSQISIVSRDLSALITSDNPNVEKIKKVLENGLNQTESKTTIQDSNDLILDRVILKHEKVRNGEKSGIELGYSTLSEKVVLEDVDVMIIGARPSMGKTAFAISTLIKLCFQLNQNVIFFALEMSKEQVMRRIISNITGISGWKIKYGKLENDEILAIESLKKLPEWNNFEIIEGTRTANEVYFETAKRHNNKKVDCLIVDYLQKLKPEKNGSKYEAVTFASNRIKELAQNLKIPTIALAQLGRANEQRGGDKKPMLSDLRDSGEIEQDASIIAFLHRPEYYGFDTNENGESTKNKGELIVAKNRDGEIGIFPFYIEPETIKWTDINNEFKSDEEIKPLSNLSQQAGVGFDDNLPF